MTIDELLEMMVAKKASDLHLKAGSPPALRVFGKLSRQDLPRMTSGEVRAAIEAITNDEQKQTFAAERELDFSYSVPGLARFRVNLFQQRKAVGGVFRVIPLKVPTIGELRLPDIVADLSMRPRGLILVTGPTGSGKSTTIAAMIEHLNTHAERHIVTIEDPIEFLHQDKLCLVDQREVGSDTKSFGAALRHVLRQDPDVIVVGEMRDQETIELAITAAETGHAVFSSIHTMGSAGTIERIVDIFPPAQQNQIRIQLASVLEGVISQTLIAEADGQGQVVATEIMVTNSAIRNLIRENKIHQINSVIQASGGVGMQLMDQALRDLYQKDRISFEDAMSNSKDPDNYMNLLGKTKR